MTNIDEVVKPPEEKKDKEEKEEKKEKQCSACGAILKKTEGM